LSEEELVDMAMKEAFQVPFCFYLFSCTKLKMLFFKLLMLQQDKEDHENPLQPSEQPSSAAE
jgi:hypothetical protein